MPDTTPAGDAAKPEEGKKSDQAKPAESKKPEEPKTGTQIPPPSPTPPPKMTNSDLLPIVLIMVAAGLLGGIVNTPLTKKEEETGWTPWKMNILIGIGAAFLVPLFLKSVDSKILDTLHIDPMNGLLLFSYCTLASISARHFITTITEQMFKKIDTIKKEAESTKQELDKTKQDVEKAKSASQSTTNLALALNDAARFQTVDLLTAAPQQKNAPALNLSDTDFQATLTKGDPWKGLFGNAAEQNGRKLAVKLDPVEGQPGLAVLSMTVTSTDPKKPLTGKVQYFLHPTFQNCTPEVDVVEGKAMLRLISYGAFTVGVLCDAGTTKLELDLSQIPGAWEPWKSR
jgi:hypothetical protein